MNNLFDTINLRESADFRTKLMNNVFWVPLNILGKPVYRTTELKNCCNYSFNDLSSVVVNPYTLVQFLQICKFEVKDDFYYTKENGVVWEHHGDTNSVLNTKSGCCSSYSCLFTDLMRKHYENIGNICIISNFGVGHIISYIKENGRYYFIDTFSQLIENIHLSAIETGQRIDFCHSSCITGVCVMTQSIEEYILFFLRYSRYKKREYSFFTYKTSLTPPISITKSKDDAVMLIIDKDMDVILDNSKKIAYTVK